MPINPKSIRMGWAMLYRRVVYASLATLFTNPVTAQGIIQPSTIEQRLFAVTEEVLEIHSQPIRALPTLRRFYAERGNRPAWSDKGGSDSLTQLLTYIEFVDQHGLRPADYHLQALRQALVEQDTVARELLATDAYLTLAAHLLGGRLDPLTIEPDWTAGRRERNLATHLQQALESGHIKESLNELTPDTPGYRTLLLALQEYRAAAQRGGWQMIPDHGPLRLGEQSPRVALLKQRLHATGLLPTLGERSELFDDAVELAVAQFQRRIGLEADGIVGPVTLKALNRTPEERIDQIRANLERWRWLPSQ